MKNSQNNNPQAPDFESAKAWKEFVEKQYDAELDVSHSLDTKAAIVVAGITTTISLIFTVLKYDKVAYVLKNHTGEISYLIWLLLSVAGLIVSLGFLVASLTTKPFRSLSREGIQHGIQDSKTKESKLIYQGITETMAQEIDTLKATNNSKSKEYKIGLWIFFGSFISTIVSFLLFMCF